MRQPRSVRLAERVSTALRGSLPVPVLRMIYRAGYRAASVWWFFTRPPVSGSKVVVTRGDQVLFIRQTYGERNTWDLPGGTAGAGERPAQTASRELFEEVGLKGELIPLGSWNGSGHARRATLHGFGVEVDQDAELVLDKVEIAEARWFDSDNPPAAVAEGSRAVLKAANILGSDA